MTINMSSEHRTTKKAPSELFLEYLFIAQMAIADSESSVGLELHAKRDRIINKLLKRRSTSISHLFEQMYIWRIECFQPGETDFVHFDDAFPLSVYFALKELSGYSWLDSPSDDFYRKKMLADAEKYIDTQEGKPAEENGNLINFCAARKASE